MKKTKILIVDDSPLVRKVVKDILGSDEMLQVVGTAHDAWSAMQKIKTLKPDVLTLDIIMPGMDGLTFLERLMKSQPMPVVMISTLTEKDAPQTFKALELGAVEFIHKPNLDVREKLEDMAIEIIDKVKAAGQAKLKSQQKLFLEESSSDTVDVLVRKSNRMGTPTAPTIIAVGASTGGTDALRDLLVPLPSNTPAILVVQHMLAHFTTPFSKRLDALCTMKVKEAEEGDRVEQGQVLVAPGGKHMVIAWQRDHFAVELQDGPMVNRVRPAVDLLFNSMASVVGRSGIGIILTGMGADGAAGLLEMKKSGARTMAQDEASSVVFGMPKMAIKAGGVDQVVSLTEMPAQLLALVDSSHDKVL